jgi:hypothetical protein
MQAEFKDRLGATVRAMVDEIECASNLDIAVVVDPSRNVGRGEGANYMGCELSECDATIITGDSAYFPDASVFHELWHVRRILVEGVPRLLSNEDFEGGSACLDTAIAHLDNNLEHLVIVPTEIEAFPDRRSYWVDRLQRGMLGAIAGSRLAVYERERFAMLALVSVECLALEPELRDEVERRYRGARCAVFASSRSIGYLQRATRTPDL